MKQHYFVSLLSSIVSSVILISNTQAEMWDGYNHPGNMDVSNNYEYNLNKLPKEAKLSALPWSETYWPANKGSINIRWNTEDKDGFNYIPPTREEVAEMNEEQIARLSPSEKYDIYMGRFDYPLYYQTTGWANPQAPDWFGMCDGWSIAALQYKEPAPIRAKSAHGYMVPFGSSDIKGLMTYAAANEFVADSRQVGSKCENRRNRYDCDDINAGSMHVILANQIGLKQQGFVTERDAGPEIWNQPTFGYKFEFLGSAYSTDGDHGILVHGTVYYTDELDSSSWEPVVGTPNFKFDRLEMDYVLDLDEYDNIIGGSWIPGADHPDFMWLPTNKLSFNRYMSGINSLYQPAAR